MNLEDLIYVESVKMKKIEEIDINIEIKTQKQSNQQIHLTLKEIEIFL